MNNNYLRVGHRGTVYFSVVLGNYIIHIFKMRYTWERNIRNLIHHLPLPR